MREGDYRAVINTDVRLIHLQKVFRNRSNLARPLAEIKIGPSLQCRGVSGIVVIEAGVVPGEEWNNPSLARSGRPRENPYLVTQGQDLVELLDRIMWSIPNPQFMIAGHIKHFT